MSICSTLHSRGRNFSPIDDRSLNSNSLPHLSISTNTNRCLSLVWCRKTLFREAVVSKDIVLSIYYLLIIIIITRNRQIHFLREVFFKFTNWSLKDHGNGVRWVAGVKPALNLQAMITKPKYTNQNKIRKSFDWWQFWPMCFQYR